MRKLITTTLLAFCIFYLGCKKQDAEPTGAFQNEPNLIKSAKEYFERIIPLNAANGQTTVNSVGNFTIDQLTKTVLWDKAITYRRNGRVMVVVPIKFNTTIFQTESFNNSFLRQKADEMTRLVIYQDSTTKFKIVLMSFFPDKKYLNNSNDKFSGMTVVKDWSGNMIQSYVYSGDSVYYIKAHTNATNDSVGTNIAQPPPGEISVQNCLTTDYYNVVGNDEVGYVVSYQYTETIGCTFGYAPIGSPNVIYQLSQIGIDAPGVGNTLYKPAMDSINIGSSVGLQERCVINEISSGGIKSGLSSIVTTLGDASDIDVNISQVRSFTDGATAHTTGTITQSPAGNYYKFSIQLSDLKLHYASQEYVAETVIHEILHAWIGYHSGIQSNMSEHQTMLNSFITDDVNALKDLFPYMNNASYNNDALCLILSGLLNDNEFSQDFVNNILSSYGLTLSQVNAVASAYQSGNKGIQCSSTPQQ